MYRREEGVCICCGVCVVDSGDRCSCVGHGRMCVIRNGCSGYVVGIGCDPLRSVREVGVIRFSIEIFRYDAMRKTLNMRNIDTWSDRRGETR